MYPKPLPDIANNIDELVVGISAYLSAQRPADGKQAMNTEFGELTVGMRIDDISINFHYGVSPKDTKSNSSGTGSISSVGADAAVNSGTGIGTGELVSVDAVRYRAGHESMSLLTHDQTALESGVDVMHGLLNSQDGLAIGSQGTEKGVWFVEGGNENFIPASSFSVDKLDGTGVSGFDWDITKRNLFMITFGYLSIAPIRYYIATGHGWQLFHTIDLINKQTEGHLKNPTLPIAMRVRRVAGSGSDVQVKAGSWRGVTIGAERQLTASDRWFGLVANRTNLAAIDIIANPNLYHNIVTLKSSTILNLKPNHIRTELAIITFVVDGNKGVEFIGMINGTLVGNDAFIAQDSLSSTISTSQNGTANGATSGATTISGKVSSQRIDVRGTGIYIRPGQTFTIGARGLGGAAVTGDISVAGRWVEEF